MRLHLCLRQPVCLNKAAVPSFWLLEKDVFQVVKVESSQLHAKFPGVRPNWWGNLPSVSFVEVYILFIVLCYCCLFLILCLCELVWLLAQVFKSVIILVMHSLSLTHSTLPDSSKPIKGTWHGCDVSLSDHLGCFRYAHATQRQGTICSSRLTGRTGTQLTNFTYLRRNDQMNCLDTSSIFALRFSDVVHFLDKGGSHYDTGVSHWPLGMRMHSKYQFS